MKERPILFSAPMVRAILEYRKTQTRRIVKGAAWKMIFFDDECDSWCGSNEEDFMNDPHAKVIPPQYGVPGDRLWVRESFQPLYADGYNDQTVNYETGKGYAPNYSADGRLVDYVDPDGNITDKCIPSIFMPRWASRITLEIEAVRVERLIEISEDGVVAEGVIAPRCEHCGYTRADARFQMDHRFCQSPEPSSAIPIYRELWESINGPGSWDANPWVWVIQFRRIQP